jgi:hypothetical protein
MQIRDRVKELRRVKAGDILPDPRNWRRHPKAQLDALRGVLQEIGIADALLARETPDGLMLIDGHGRQELDSKTLWPVLILDVNEDEAAEIMATLDPLAAMAQADQKQLDALLQDVQSGEAAVQQMLSDLAAREGIVPPDFEPVGIEEQGRLDEKKKVVCPECGHEFTPS